MLDIEGLATQLVEASEKRGKTPLIRVGRDVVLQPAFYQALLVALVQRAGRDVRVEVVAAELNWRSGLQVSRSKRSVERAMRQLRRQGGLSFDVQVQRRVLLSRAAGVTRPFVLGIADELESIPAWAHGLRVARQALDPQDIQIVTPRRTAA